MPHLKMVDQDQFPDEQDNDKARFLAQKNHNAAEDTQSNSRNLVQNMTGEQVAERPRQRRPAAGRSAEKGRRAAGPTGRSQAPAGGRSTGSRGAGATVAGHVAAGDA